MSESEPKGWVYILELQSDKYYVGWTTKPTRRYDEHVFGIGASWTKKYGPPKGCVVQYKDCTKFDEDKYTLEYMKKYGTDNVRGGAYCQIKLNTNQKGEINRRIRGASGVCFKCGGNHFVSKCSKDELPAADQKVIREIKLDKEQEVDEDKSFKKFNDRYIAPDANFIPEGTCDYASDYEEVPDKLSAEDARSDRLE